MKNPFSLKIVVHPDHFCNRKKEMEQLISYASSDSNAVIYSPRRFGKTSLVCQVQQRLEKSKFMTIYIDLFGLSSADNIAKRIAQGLYAAIYEEKSMLQKAVSIIKTHRPVLRPDETGISISAESVSPNLSGTELLDKTMAEFGEFLDAGKKQVNIVLDEFQEITEIRNRDTAGPHPAPAGQLLFCRQPQTGTARDVQPAPAPLFSERPQFRTAQTAP